MCIRDRGISVESDGELTVGLNTLLDEKLIQEGFIRELVHHIQNIRKDAGFEIENIIETHIKCSREAEDIITGNMEFIKKETLSDVLNFNTETTNMYSADVKINEENIKISVKVIR